MRREATPRIFLDFEVDDLLGVVTACLTAKNYDFQDVAKHLSSTLQIWQ